MRLVKRFFPLFLIVLLVLVFLLLFNVPLVSASSFGNDTVGGSQANTNNVFIVGNKATLPEDGTVTSISIYWANNAAEIKIKVGMYDGATQPTNVVLTEAEFTVPINTVGWQTYDVVDTAEVAGTYWLCFQADSDPTGKEMRYNATAEGFYASHTYANAWTSSPSHTDWNVLYSMYANYTATPPPTPTPTPTPTPPPSPFNFTDGQVGTTMETAGDFSAWTSTVSSGGAHVDVDDYLWNKYGEVLAQSGEAYCCWGSVLKVSSAFHMFYSSSTGILKVCHANSTDGKSWVKDASHNPVLDVGASGKFDDSGVYCPMVWYESPTWYMLYTGINSSSCYAIGLAESSDGLTWTKQNGGNAVLNGTVGEWDENHAENWGVIKVGSTYYLWYNIVGAGGRQVGLATSTDLITWSKDANNPLFTSDRFCSFPFKIGSTYYLAVTHYTYGNDYSEVELYSDSNPTFYVGDRTYLGSIVITSTSGFDLQDLDTPCILTDDVTRSTYNLTPNEYWCYYSGQHSGGWSTGLTIRSQSTFAHHGVNCAKITVPNTQNDYVYYQKNFSETYSTAYMQTYFYFHSFPNASKHVTVLSPVGTVGLQTGTGVYNDSGTYKWELYYRNGSSWNSTLIASPNPALNTWYCVKLKTVVDASTGEYRLYVDSSEIATETSLDNSAFGNIAGIRIGDLALDSYSNSQMEIYFDCVTASDANIESETAGTNYAIGLTLSTPLSYTASNKWQATNALTWQTPETYTLTQQWNTKTTLTLPTPLSWTTTSQTAYNLALPFTQSFTWLLHLSVTHIGVLYAVDLLWSTPQTWTMQAWTGLSYILDLAWTSGFTWAIDFLNAPLAALDVLGIAAFALIIGLTALGVAALVMLKRKDSG